MNSGITYLAKSKTGLAIININTKGMEAYFHPCFHVEGKIRLYMDFIDVCGDVIKIQINDLIGNGDATSFCNKGYGTEFMTSAFIVVDD